MIKSSYFPEKTFSTKEELFKELKESSEIIMEQKKSLIQKSCDKGISVTCKSLDLLKFTDQLKGIKIDDNFYYIAVNSTRILDSHDDLHIDGLWKKSIKEQQGRNYLVVDHDLSIKSVVVRKEHIEIFTAKIPFSLIGKPYSGDTEVLIYKVPKDKVKDETVKDWLDSGDSIEGSVRMQYVTILFAMDSNDPENATEKKNYDDYLEYISNKEDFDYIYYYFIIKEAKNVKESSLVVFGSNPATGQVMDKNNPKPSDDTSESKNEPSVRDTQERKNKITFI